ncbi:MAG: metal ABC transporter permease [Saprospiraceae bacterium]
MTTLLEVLQQEWAIRALIASSLVGVMCGVLGCFIVLRNMSLVGDALAHAILPGVVFAFVLVGYSALGFFTGAVIAGLVTAIGITWIQHNVGTKNDAAIGIVFTAMFSIGVMGISWISRNEGVHLDLKDFLFGNVLGVANSDLFLTAGVTVYVVASVMVFYRFLFVTTFQSVIAETMGVPVQMIHYFLMLLLSFAVVASLQTVGVILVVAMLITPASTALLLSNRLPRVIVISAIVGLFSAVLGLVLAILFETTPGPAMAVTATFFYIIAVFFAPEKGLVFRFFRTRKLKHRIKVEDGLKQAYRLQEEGLLTFDSLAEKLGINQPGLQKILQLLRSRGFIEKTTLKLTDLGVGEAEKLVRAHRLWETYLVNKMGLNNEQIHDEAERYEHLLPESLLDAVDKELGFPSTDPHGSPIPAKQGYPSFPLIRLAEQEVARIAKHQANQYVMTQLWRLGLLPGASFQIQQKDQEQFLLKSADHDISVPVSLASQINVELKEG